jgi:hypothetical protein
MNKWKMHKDRDDPWFQMTLENSGRVRENTKCIGSRADRDISPLSINCLLCLSVCASFVIRILKMDSLLSLGRWEKEANVNGKILGQFVRQSATMKLALFLVRGRVVDYVGWFFH